ncbi:hypothetical protein [Microbacterium sp. CIAB417]|uniref:hypothetical protein n=1 Tax=Microbacterium sp. CIAB417 TaxID=2860287 RepID=UPI001FAC178A|nr:hypothetical protein [Microbacterium sp. CIAB417]
MNVVVVTTASEPMKEPLGELPDTVRLMHVTWGGREVQNHAALAIAAPNGPLARFGTRLSRVLQRGPVLRMLERVSPLDRGARFWRAVRHDERIPTTLADADLLVAGDRDANLACWHLARRLRIAAVSGYAAGTKEVLQWGMQ